MNDIPDEGNTPEELVLCHEGEARIYRAIRQLPEHLQEVMWLLAGGANRKEIAEKIGKAMRTVNDRIKKGQARLKDLLDEK